MEQLLPSLNVFRSEVSLGTYDQLLDVIADKIQTQTPLFVDTSNTVVLSLSAVNNKFRRALKAFDILLPDARPLVWYLQLLGGDIHDTCYGPETALRVWHRFSGTNKIMVIGSTEKTRKAFETKFIKPARWLTEIIDLKKKDHLRWVEQEIKSTDPDIIFLALGCPKSYFLLHEIKHAIKRAVVIHVGGSFDLISGQKKITPVWLQRIGMGWFYRFTQEPGRLWKRYLKFNTLFLLCVCIYYLSDKKKFKTANSHQPPAKPEA